MFVITISYLKPLYYTIVFRDLLMSTFSKYFVFKNVHHEYKVQELRPVFLHLKTNLYSHLWTLLQRKNIFACFCTCFCFLNLQLQLQSISTLKSSTSNFANFSDKLNYLMHLNYIYEDNMRLFCHPVTELLYRISFTS